MNGSPSSSVEEKLDILDIESIRKNNYDQARIIFDFLSSLFLTSIYDKQQQRYIKSFAKHIYRWARIESYHSSSFGEHANNKKIEKLMTEFSKQFNKKYLPPFDHDDNKQFYEIYPTQSLKDFIKKYTKKASNMTSTRNISVCIPIIKAPKNRKQKVLLLLDFDDTLLPSTMIKSKNHQITINNTTYSERIEINRYCESLNDLMDTILPLFDYNRNRNVQILTNASAGWIKDESMFHSGRYFAVKMIPFAQKIGKYKIDIISALDNWRAVCKYYKGGFNAIEPHKWKWEIMGQLFNEQFGKKLNDKYDIKIISIGDSYQSEYQGAGAAFKDYLNAQNIEVLKSDINISLHRIKFIEQPTFKQLTRELMWCSQNIKSIVSNQHKSASYILKGKI